ncbi:septation protein SepH [Subtercola frigoramans]|uniref:Transcriptional regulator with XRE-family HTH domain n=1 Tax=Subtercola frigoramans TaxID=120298 RepID=A0ABS2L507_9MICO|nr:septation protein SepH [Subtercola frigoramans]MBM7472099.1 transcriptional regulator with XRE-family HTH domain [Subtercola frigoramans]
MQDLTVIGIENGALLVTSETGERYRVAIDEVLQSRLRQSTTTPTAGVKVSPREIQSQIRAGMSAEDVARATGATLEYVERFEGPVLAERLHIVSSALRVPVKIASSVDPLRSDPLSDDQASTFGDVIEERLAGLEAVDLRWASWKEEAGWIVKLTFTASTIDHDARWQFDVKRHTLVPLNSGAVTLSQQGEISDGLIPRLRVVDRSSVDRSAGGRDRADGTRHERDVRQSDGLSFDELDSALDSDPSTTRETATIGNMPATGASVAGVPAVLVEPTPFARSSSESSAAASAAAVNRAAERPAAHNETADLLEALRRRRGERESASFLVDASDDFDLVDAPDALEGETRPMARLSPFNGFSGKSAAATGVNPETGEIALDGLEVPTDDAPTNQTPPTATAASAGRKRASRTAMPSWDEIVFGARSDDDLG